jgi:hypothetical protein
MRRRELPQNPNWRSVHWQTPRSITVDVGREAAARRDDVKAGLMTLADFFGEQGLDWKTAMQEIAAERQFAAELGVVVGVERTEGATVIDPVPTGDGGSTPPASTPEEFTELDCGTGAGGFKPGNDCAKGGGTGSKKKTESKPESAGGSKHRAINDFEDTKRNQSFESIIVVDKNGEILFEGDGDEKSVLIPAGTVEELDGVNGLTISHNHPNGMSFSERDWQTAKELNVDEIRAVSEKYTYVLKKPERQPWPTKTPVEFIRDQSEGPIFNKYNDLVLQQKMSIPEANQEYWHEVTGSIAKYFGASYERIKR